MTGILYTGLSSSHYVTIIRVQVEQSSLIMNCRSFSSRLSSSSSSSLKRTSQLFSSIDSSDRINGTLYSSPTGVGYTVYWLSEPGRVVPGRTNILESNSIFRKLVPACERTSLLTKLNKDLIFCLSVLASELTNLT